MTRDFFLKTGRIGFSSWGREDIGLAGLLWGDPEVTRYICASGVFSAEEIAARLETEIANGAAHGVQYWPIFELATGGLIGCCGLRPHGGGYELGFHLRAGYWGQGYAAEAAKAVIGYAFTLLRAERLFAGHHPDNERSRRLLARLGFRHAGSQLYPPTGLMHPWYELTAAEG